MKTHKQSNTEEYKIWKDMRKRCNNKNCKAYKYYGERGINVCNRWNDYVNFISDMGKRPGKEYSIDRRDNDKGYCPENCYWATKIEQMNNRSNSVFLEFNNKNMSISQWSRELNIDKKTLYSRYENGWDTEKILLTPIKKSNRITNNTYIEYNNQKLTLSEWSRKTGINYSTIRERNRKGLPPELIFVNPKTGELFE